MTEVDTFTNGARPEHLAICNERQDDQHGQFRAACGRIAAGKVMRLPTYNLDLSCPDCQWQLEKWLELKASPLDDDE